MSDENISAIIQASGPTAMQDRDVCLAVSETLTRAYPGYPWLVGANHEAGTVVIDLELDKPIGLSNYAYLLHIPTLMAPGAQTRVLAAGGELLERFGLQRGAAPKDVGQRAAEGGFDITGAIGKSRPSDGDMR